MLLCLHPQLLCPPGLCSRNWCYPWALHLSVTATLLNLSIGWQPSMVVSSLEMNYWVPSAVCTLTTALGLPCPTPGGSLLPLLTLSHFVTFAPHLSLPLKAPGLLPWWYPGKLPAPVPLWHPPLPHAMTLPISISSCFQSQGLSCCHP